MEKEEVEEGLVTSLGNIQRMLNDRGYIVNKKINELDLHNWDESVPFALATHPGTKQSIHLMLMLNNTAIAKLRQLRTWIVKGSQDTILLLTKEPPRCASEFPELEFFTLVETQHCLVDHEFVPQHTLVKENSLPRSVKRDDLAKLLWDDPVRRYYNFPLGSIVKIIRQYIGANSNMAIPSEIVYRQVV